MTGVYRFALIIFILKSKIDIGVSILGTTRENQAGAGAGVGMVGSVGLERKKKECSIFGSEFMQDIGNEGSSLFET